MDEEGVELALSRPDITYTAYSPSSQGDDEPVTLNADTEIDVIIGIFSNEFYNNVECNRNNLACPITNYFEVTGATTDMVIDPPTFSFNFTLYKNPFDYDTNSNVKLLTGSHTAKGLPKSAAKIIEINNTNDTVTLRGNYETKIFATNPEVTIKNSTNSNNNVNYTISNVAYNSGLNKTVITLSGSPNLAEIGELGSLYYNTQTSADLLQSINSVLFDIAYNGAHEENYNFEDYSGSIKFNILDRCKDTLATSEESNFDNGFTFFIDSHQGIHLRSFTNTPGDPSLHKQVEITGNTDSNNAVHTVQSAFINNGQLIARVTSDLEPVAGGELLFDGSLPSPFFTVNRSTRTFTLPFPATRIFFQGNQIQIINSDLNNGTYTIKSIELNGSGGTNINVEERIDSDTGNLGDMYVLTKLPITNIIPNGGGNSDIYVTCGAGMQAVREMVTFINTKFFNHEGFHLVENNLLRPKNKLNAYVPLVNGQNTLTVPVSNFGYLTYTKLFPVSSVNNASEINSFYLTGNIIPTLETNPLATKVVIKNSTNGINNNTYTLISFSFDGTFTRFRVFEPIPSGTLGDNGIILYKKTSAITAMTINSVTVVEDQLMGHGISEAHPAAISGTNIPASNAHTFKIDEVTYSGINAIVSFKAVLTDTRDKFLPINEDEEGEDCKITDPYSFIGRVVLPYWQGRFINQDFRQHLERSIETECPAHIVLSTCWVSNDHMLEFELKYKKWLVENSKKTKDIYLLSMALNDLIEVMNRLRTVYPVGTLHDCETDPEAKNSIILNRSVIGTIQI